MQIFPLYCIQTPDIRNNNNKFLNKLWNLQIFLMDNKFLMYVKHFPVPIKFLIINTFVSFKSRNHNDVIILFYRTTCSFNVNVVNSSKHISISYRLARVHSCVPYILFAFLSNKKINVLNEINDFFYCYALAIE